MTTTLDDKRNIMTGSKDDLFFFSKHRKETSVELPVKSDIRLTVLDTSSGVATCTIARAVLTAWFDHRCDAFSKASPWCEAKRTLADGESLLAKVVNWGVVSLVYRGWSGFIRK
jgi:hypothetical protein